MAKVVVQYAHNPADLAGIFLAIVPGRTNRAPNEDEWKPAYRDVVHKKPVVWARFDNTQGSVWIRDKYGMKRTLATFA